MGYFGELIDDLGYRVKEFDVGVATNRLIAGRYINRSAKRTYVAHPWEWRQKTGQVTLIPNYVTGSCAVTGFDGTNSAAARTVNFSGATLAANMQGRFIKVDGEDFWHRIENVDTTNGRVYLDSEITRATGSGLGFQIWKRFYHLPGEVAAITDFGRWENRWGRLQYSSFSSLVDDVADIADDGTPNKFIPFGVDNYEPVYSTGTITGSKDQNILTGGTGAAWLGNILSGDEIIAGENKWTVKRVEQDQRLILNNYLVDDVPAGTTYEARRNLSVGFQFYPNQFDSYQTVPYAYYDRMFDMVHDDKDRPNLPDDFDDAILTLAEAKLRKDKGDSTWGILMQLYKSELDDLKINFRVVKPRYDIFAPRVSGYTGR
jgi:hypothetical protein